jgi:predicted Zn finger-like uncharacterized protein
MIIACESCKTKFRLDPSRLKGSRSKVRCSRCGSVFAIPEPEEEDFVHVDLSDDTDIEPEQPSTKAPPSPATTTTSTTTVSQAPPKVKKPFPVKTLLLVLVPLLVLGGGLIWITMNKDALFQPAPPPTAKTGGKEAVLPSVSILDSTQAYFLQNSHIGQIFVVEGEVASESPNPVSFILLEGRLYTKNNHIAQSQRCYAGNPLTREDLIRLGVTELQNRMMNREGKDLTNVNIPPSKRIPFLLVFHNLPELDALTDYSIEVVSAKAD